MEAIIDPKSLPEWREEYGYACGVSTLPGETPHILGLMPATETLTTTPSTPSDAYRVTNRAKCNRIKI